MEKDIPNKGKPKDSRSAHLHQMKQTLKSLTRDKEGHYVMKRGQLIKRIQQLYIDIQIYAFYPGEPKY